MPALWEQMHVFWESYKIITILLESSKKQNGLLLSVREGGMSMQSDHWTGDSNEKFRLQHS